MGLGAGQNMVFTVDTLSISTAGQAHIYMPFRGRIISLTATQHIALATADTDIGVKIGGTVVAGLLFTIAFTGAAPGITDSATPDAVAKNAAGGYFEAGDSVEIESDGVGATGTASFTLVVSAQDR